MPNYKYSGLNHSTMTLEEVLFVKELVPNIIRSQGGITIWLESSETTIGGISIKDSVGFTVGRIDPNGNFHMRGDIIKDL